MTGSLIIGFFAKVLEVLNRWYENSLIHKAAAAVARWSHGSAAVNFFRRFAPKTDRDYIGGSLVMRAFRYVGSAVWRFFERLYTLVKPALDGSFIVGILRMDAIVLRVLRPETAYCIFVMLMSVIPNDYWSNTYIMIAAAALFLLYAVNRLAGSREKSPHAGIPVPILLYFAVVMVNLFISPAFSDSLRVVIILASCAVIGVLTQNIIDTKKKFEALCGVLFAALIITSLYGMYQYIMGIEVRADLSDLYTNPGLRRVFSTMANPNNYAEYLILFLPFCVSFALSRKGELQKFICCGLLLPIFAALVLTSSRSAYLVVVGQAALYVLLTKKRLVPFFIVAGFAAIPFLPDSITDRVLTIGNDTSSTYRLMIWEASLELLKTSWLAGVGVGPEAFGKAYRAFANPNALNAMHAHNLFLQLWLENGILSFLAIITFYIGTVRRMLKNTDIYKTAALCSLVGFAVFGMVEYTWFYPRVQLAFWIVCGMALSLNRIKSREE